MIQGQAVAHPSLALIKYWGKRSLRHNTPATSSLAVTIDTLKTSTVVQESEKDRIVLNGQQQDPLMFKAFLDHLRQHLGLKGRFFSIITENNFPTAAGLASSSSGFAALTGALAAFSGKELSRKELSNLARLGSGSATRSIWGGFTIFAAGAKAAVQEHEETFWPELRIVAAITSQASKSFSSKKAMEKSRLSSPYYSAWTRSCSKLFKNARKALDKRDLASLGPLMRQSYLRMFATIFTSDPPLFYWKEQSLRLILALEELRTQGLQVWETMDAGPQVKIFCLEKDLSSVLFECEKRVNTDGQIRFLVAKPGAGLQISRAWV